MKRIFFETGKDQIKASLTNNNNTSNIFIDDFEKATKNLKKSEEYSDINCTVNDDVTSKRTSKRVRRLISSDGFDIEELNNNQIPRPPKVPLLQTITSHSKIFTYSI